MKVQLKRIVRTPQSEQYALFDLQQTDEEALPLSLGKVDLHYAADGIYGTLLLWQAYFAHFSEEELRQFVQETMDEFVAPMGVPGEFLVECVVADEQDCTVYSNMLDTRDDMDEASPE